MALVRGGSILVGREAETATLEKWFADPTGPMVIVGHGGMGKTSLARDFARRQVRNLFVDAVSAASFEDVCLAIAKQAGLDTLQRPSVESLRAAIGDRAIDLLIVDNVEQLGEELPRLSALRTITARILLTSRVATTIPGEIILQVGPLPVDDDWESPAIRLLRRGSAEVHSVDETGAMLAFYHRIARAADGIPLALEFAGRKIATFGVEWTADRFDQSLLTIRNDVAGRPLRQRTLNESIEWSWDMLTKEDQEVLAALSIFVGSFDRAQSSLFLAGMADDAEAVFTRLASQGFLVTDNAREGARRLLVPVREFARQKLEEMGVARAFEPYAQSTLDLAQRQVARFFGTTNAQSGLVLEALRPELTQIVEPPPGARVTPRQTLLALDALARLAVSGGTASSYVRLVRGEAAARVFKQLDPSDQVLWLTARSNVERVLGDYTLALTSAYDARARSGDDASSRCVSLLALASALSVSALEDAYEYAREAFDLARELGIPSLECEAAYLLGYLCRFLAYQTESRSFTEQGYAIAKEHDLYWPLSRIPAVYGYLLADADVLDAAEAILREGIERVATNSDAGARLRSSLAAVLANRQKWAEAVDTYEAAYEIALRSDARPLAAHILKSKAAILLAMNDFEQMHVSLERAAKIYSDAAILESSAMEIVYLGHTGRFEEGSALARDIYTIKTRDSAWICARAILLYYELKAYEASRKSADATAVRETLRLLYAPDDLGVSWHSKNADVRAFIRGATAKLEDLRFEVPSTNTTNVILELRTSDRGSSAVLGRIALENIGAAPFRLLEAFARRSLPNFSIEQLFRFGWPGESATPKAAHNRVHVAISYLRKNLLGGLLVRVGDVYSLDARVIFAEGAKSQEAPPS